MESLSDSVASLKLGFSKKEGENRDIFSESYEEILSSVYSKFPEITRHGGDMKETLDWLTSVLNYNVPHGKQLRGRMVVEAYKILVPNASEEKLNQARLLGWIVEILQAASLVADDIMDGGRKRRGKPCWYLLHNMGASGFNDAVMLEHFATELVRIHFGDSPSYVDLCELFYGIAFKTIMGQCLDLRTSKVRNLDLYTTSKYHSVVNYKTGYYTTYGPLAVAMILAGMSPKKSENKKIWTDIEEICLKVGTLFQIQDDYFDCYADEKILGKVASDIQEGKCSWLFVTAKDKCNSEQLKVLMENYGVDEKEKVDVIKKLYNDLNLPKHFRHYQRKIYEELLVGIKSLDHKPLQVSMTLLLKQIYKRSF